MDSKQEISPQKVLLDPKIANRREEKSSNKKSALYMKIMKEHGLDGSSMKLNYEFPASKLKPRTPVHELFGNIMRNEKEISITKEMSTEKLTVAKPFDFQTAKRMRLQTQFDQLSESEISTNKEGRYEPLCQ